MEYSKVVSDLRKTFASGKTRPIEHRLHQLNQYRLMIDENENEIYEALQKDLHKCKVEAHVMEVMQCRIETANLARNLKEWMAPEKVPVDIMNIGNTAIIQKEPKGVVLIIGAWNYPILLALKPVLGAIAAGNCVVLKPSELAPNVDELVGKLIPKYLDQDCIRVVSGGIPETTALLREKFDHILYTGSSMVGKIILRAAAEHLTPCTLELGGKCPVLMDKTCDIDVIAQRICWAKYCNTGQTCLAADYVLCIKGMEDKFVASLKKAIIKFYGEDPKLSESYGRMINNRHFNRVKKLINDSKVVHGGITDEKELYISPTIMNNVTKDDLIMHDEIFGPIMPIVVVDSIEEAVNFVNEREKPLALYVFSKDKKVVDYVIANTSSGGVSINDALVHAAVPSLPFGGVGHSGMGAYHFKASFDTFSHRKSCLYKNQMLEFVNEIRYPPYSEQKKTLNFLCHFLVPSMKKRNLNWLYFALAGFACAMLYHYFKF